MSVVMRPYHDVVAPDLQRAYDKSDREVMECFVTGARVLRDLSQLHPGQIGLGRKLPPNFDLARYDALKRTALQLASDLERAIANSGLAK